MLPNGESDPLSLHAGCDVESDDVKWSANKWLWNKPRLQDGWAGDEEDLQRYRNRDLLPQSKHTNIVRNDFLEIHSRQAKNSQLLYSPIFLVIAFVLVVGTFHFSKRQINNSPKKKKDT